MNIDVEHGGADSTLVDQGIRFLQRRSQDDFCAIRREHVFQREGDDRFVLEHEDGGIGLYHNPPSIRTFR